MCGWDYKQSVTWEGCLPMGGVCDKRVDMHDELRLKWVKMRGKQGLGRPCVMRIWPITF